MRRCSILVALFFCIDHVAWLEAVGVHNWSSIFNNNPSKNWVVLVAGTNTWANYRHQADVFHAYQLVRKNNVPPENIITFAYDDIANNPRNPFRGKVFHDYMHEDVYNGVIIDYRGKDVTRDNFVNVLTGNKELEANKKKVLKSGPDDNVFLFFSGHGGVSFLRLIAEDLHAVELNDILAHMHSKKKYNKMVLYVEACYSGSLFRNILPPNMGIYVITSAKEDEQSWSIFCTDKDIDTCLASEFAYAWTKDSEYHDMKRHTLDQQYEEAKKVTADSHVMKYGEMAMGSLLVGKFQGHYVLPMHRSDGTIPLSHIFKETLRDIVVDVTTHHKPTLKGLSKSDELMCFQAVFDQFRTHCFTIQKVPEVAQHTTRLMELCKAGYEAEILIDSVHNVCS